MPDVTPLKTDFLNAINTGLSSLGETPVSAPDNTSTNVILAKQIIVEVSRDVQSKGWWFNTTVGTGAISILSNSNPETSSEDFNTLLPEEARRYISIRASRILQARFLGSEDLYKFSMMEEQVSYAVLTQAHVRNGGNGTSFNSFPAALKSMGVEEFMFLQGNAEEKLLTIRLTTELNTAAKLTAETSLIGSQENLVDTQVLTEVQTGIKTAAESGLITAQQALVSQQVLEAVANISKIGAETLLIGEQENLVEQQVLTEAQTVIKTAAEALLTEKQGGLVDAQKSQTLTEALLRSQQALTEVENTGKVAAETSLMGEQEDLVEAQALDVAADTALKTSQKTQLDAQTAIEATAEKNFYDGVVTGAQDTYRDYAAEMRMMGVQESTFQQLLAYKKIEVLKDAAKLRLATMPDFLFTLVPEEKSLETILRLIGEPTSANSSSNSLARVALETFRATHTELQGRGWWFNTEMDVELPVVTKFIVSGNGGQWDGIYAYNATNGRYERTNGNNVHYFSKTDTNDTNTVGTWVLASEHPAGVYDATFDANVGTGAYPDPALFEIGTLVIEHGIPIPADVLSVEANDYDTLIKTVGGVRYLYDLKTKSTTSWTDTVKAKIIYERPVEDVPQKYLEYLEVRVAIILTELYPQSGADTQRLPKMEAELRAYFKDREFDEADYTVFDNYDTAARIGINRNYNLF